VTVVFGVLLIALGLVGYFATDRVSWTALIPAFFGAALLVLGLLGYKEHLRKHVMHAAAMVALIGLVGALVRVVPKVPALVKGEPIEHRGAFVYSALMAALCAAFVALCVRSFILARRRRADAGG
jgi:uncharacterized membrane protein